MSKMLAYFIGLALIIPTSIWNGFVCSVIWNWYAVPLGATHCSVYLATGLSLLVPLLRLQSNPISSKETLSKDKSGSDIFEEIFFSRVLSPTIILALAILIHIWGV